MNEDFMRKTLSERPTRVVRRGPGMPYGPPAGFPSVDHQMLERNAVRVGKGFLAYALFCVIVGAVIIGIAAWAVIRLVLHFT